MLVERLFIIADFINCMFPNFENLSIKEDVDAKIKYDKNIKAIALNPKDRTLLLMITASSELVVVNTDTLVPKSVLKLPFETKRVSRMKITEKGTLIVQTDKSTLVCFNLNSSSIISTIRLEKSEITAFDVETEEMESLFIGSNQGYLYFVPIKQDGNAQIDFNSGKQEHREQITDIIVACKDFLFTSGFDNQIKVVKSKDGTLSCLGVNISVGASDDAVVDLLMDIPMKLDLSESGTYLYAGAMDGTVYQISVSTFNSELGYDFGFGAIRFLKSIFDTQIIVVDESGKIGVLDLQNGNVLEETMEPKIIDLAYSQGILYVLVPGGEIHTYSFLKYFD